MLLPLTMISSYQNDGKSTLLAKFGAVLLFCGSLENFWYKFVRK